MAEAIARGEFHLYAVEPASQGIEVLTGLPAGERDAGGRFPAASVFGRVERRIIEIAEKLREAEGHAVAEAVEALEEAPGARAWRRDGAAALRWSWRRGGGSVRPKGRGRLDAPRSPGAAGASYVPADPPGCAFASTPTKRRLSTRPPCATRWPAQSSVPRWSAIRTPGAGS